MSPWGYIRSFTTPAVPCFTNLPSLHPHAHYAGRCEKGNYSFSQSLSEYLKVDIQSADLIDSQSVGRDGTDMRGDAQNPKFRECENILRHFIILTLAL